MDVVDWLSELISDQGRSSFATTWATPIFTYPNGYGNSWQSEWKR